MAISKIVTNSVDSGVTLTSPVINTITSAAATALTLQSAGTTAITVDTSQNVGIGNTTPSSFDATGRNLVVGSGSGNQGMTVYAGTTGYASVNFADGTTGSDRYAGQVSYDHTNNALLFATTTGIERMRINSSGNLLVGTTTEAPTAPFNGTAVAGVFRTIATSGIVTNGGNTTLFTITVDTVYLVTVQTQNASGLSTTAIVRYATGGNPVATTTLYADNAGFAVTVSGTAVRITNNLGGNVAFSHNSVRIC